MSKSSEKLTAHEFVWAHRLRQRITFERILLTVGNPQERKRAKQFLQAMEKANPELLEDLDHHPLEDLYDTDNKAPELFDESEYSKARGRQTALKLPKDIRWEERAIRRAVKEYGELFHPCELTFGNAMKGLLYLSNLLPELFAAARALAIEQREQILIFEIDCQCDCTSKEDRQPANSFKITNQGRFKNVSKRIISANQVLKSAGGSRQGEWQFFLDRIRDIAPEMLN